MLLGDSHSYGQGSPDYEGSPIYYSHMASPTNKGYYARLCKHVEQKLEFSTAPILPFSNRAALYGRSREERCMLKGPFEASGFYAPAAYKDRAAEHLGYLAEDGKFSDSVFVISQRRDGDVQPGLRFQLDTHSRKLFIGVAAGPHGAKLEIRLQASSYYVIPPGYPTVHRVRSGHMAVVSNQEAATSSDGSVVIDTFCESALQEFVYCIDYGKKQKGTVSLSYAGEHPAASGSTDEPAVRIRGIVMDGNRIRNFAMGGHTVGQWLGDGTRSFHDESYAHVDELLNYVPFTPTLAIVQAPIVNEYIRQTDICTFQRNLSVLIEKLKAHLNPAGDCKMDVLLFTTPGDQKILYQGARSLSIAYNDYYEAVRQFCLNDNWGFIDFRRYFADVVEAGMLDHDLLYDDSIHPSPFVNEWIAKGLMSVFDMLA